MMKKVLVCLLAAILLLTAVPVLAEDYMLPDNSGGLYTYTVIYHMKPRAEMSPEESAKALKNMIDAVNVTTNQNFYIVNNDFSPVGLKGLLTSP